MMKTYNSFGNMNHPQQNCQQEKAATITLPYKGRRTSNNFRIYFLKGKFIISYTAE